MKSKTTAGLLGILFGGLGLHKFYLGESGKGLLYILFCWTFIPAIVGVIEGIMLLSGSDDAFNAKYNSLVMTAGRAGGRDSAAQLADLSALKAAGSLTEEEYAAQKERLLSR